jgi:hypothetical protein
LASWHSEEAFLRVQLDSISVKVVESFSQVVDERGGISGFDDDVVDINLNIPTNLLPEAGFHALLIGCTRIF